MEKDIYNPVSDADILGELRKGKGKIRKSRKAKGVKSSGMNLRTKFMLIGSISFFVISFVSYIGVMALVKTNEFFDTHYLATHKVIETKFSWPITVEKKEAVVAYVPMVSDTKPTGKKLTQDEKKEVIRGANFSKVLTGIWMLETTQGKGANDSDPTNHQSNCDKVGGSNEFGYDPFGKTCFSSFEESVAFLDGYIEDHLEDMSLNATLCVYNTGKATDTCEYAQNFHALDKQGKLALR